MNDSSISLHISCERSEHPFFVADPIHQPIENNEVDIWYAPLAPFVHICDTLLEELSLEERTRATRFHFEKDRNRFIIGHYLLRHVLADYTKQKGSDLKFDRLKFGKPFLVEHPELQFNFSDTKNAILIGVTTHYPLGVDVETMQRKVDHEGVAEHFFMNQEIQELKNASDPKYRFLEFWTRKEAILKASGVGIMEDVRALQVNKDQQEVSISHKDMIALSADRYYVITGAIGADNIISIATPKPISSFSVFDPLQL